MNIVTNFVWLYNMMKKRQCIYGVMNLYLYTFYFCMANVYFSMTL